MLSDPYLIIGKAKNRQFLKDYFLKIFMKKILEVSGKLFLIFLVFISISLFGRASALPDRDNDGISDEDETSIYKTDPEKKDTDGDGFSDWTELNNGYSPLSSESLKLEETDYDKDGLTDRMELNFHTDLTNADTDGDGHLDGIEIANGYDPNDPNPVKLPKRIEINIGKAQELSYFLGEVRMGKFLVSSGVPAMPTPKGHFTVTKKSIKAWSSYGLWMPYWMGLDIGRFGIHQLPYWPDGRVEGEDHLGSPASHGCVRLGKEGAEFIYDWVEIGTPVFIY